MKFSSKRQRSGFFVTLAATRERQDEEASSQRRALGTRGKVEKIRGGGGTKVLAQLLYFAAAAAAKQKYKTVKFLFYFS